MRLKQKLALLAAIIATLVSAWTAVGILGREVRLVELIAIFAGGFGAGASVAVALGAVRLARANAAAAPNSAEDRGSSGAA